MTRIVFVSTVCIALIIAGQEARSQTFSFGIMSDTQWTVTDDGKNPNQIAANIVKQLDQQFINAGVKLVVAMGDTTDNGTQANDYARALYAQDLYNAGIGFFPIRGNHEAANGDPANATSGADFLHCYPQITNGLNNATPADVTTAVINPQSDLANNPPAAKIGAAFTVGSLFTSPSTNATTGGVSYAFRYNNATFMCLDQFNGTDYYSSTIPSQQSWIDSTLSSRPAGTQAFVFTHKNILGGNHKDNMFGGQVTSADPGDGYGLSVTGSTLAALVAKQTAENNFLASMQANNVQYVISGHDHHEYQSVVTSPDGASKVHQLITASDSSKFYTPGNPVSGNDVPVAQQLSRVGYNIVTVDGPRVTIDYYADTTNSNYSGPFNFVKQYTTGYSLNGKELLVPQGASYALTDNTSKAVANGETGYLGTSAAIVSGTNGSTAKTNYNKAMEKDINTGWAPNQPGLASDIFSLWGMTDLGQSTTDPYVISVGYQPSLILSGDPTLLYQGSNGAWQTAGMTFMGDVDPSTIVANPSNVGQYGYYDHGGTPVAWAVVNHDSNFAVAVPEPSTFVLLGAVLAAMAVVRSRRRAA